MNFIFISHFCTHMERPDNKIEQTAPKKSTLSTSKLACIIKKSVRLFISKSHDLDVHPAVYRDDGIVADGQEMKRHFKGNVKQSGRYASSIRSNHSICSLHLISLHQISSNETDTYHFANDTVSIDR